MNDELPRRAPFTAADLSSWIDVESLSRWFVSVIFCATTDPFQGEIFRDETQPGARWFWVNWDMDHSFMDFYGYVHLPWRHDTFDTTLGVGSFESRALTQLIDRDPVYRAYLADMFLDALNYRLTPSFLDERYRYYREIAERYELEDDRYLEPLREFLTERPDHVRRLLVKHLDLEPLGRLRLEGRPGEGLEVDGHPVPSDFIGWYLPGTEITVRLGPPSDDFSHWLVNGERVTAPRVTLASGSAHWSGPSLLRRPSIRSPNGPDDPGARTHHVKQRADAEAVLHDLRRGMRQDSRYDRVLGREPELREAQGPGRFERPEAGDPVIGRAAASSALTTPRKTRKNPRPPIV